MANRGKFKFSWPMISRAAFGDCKRLFKIYVGPCSLFKQQVANIVGRIGAVVFEHSSSVLRVESPAISLVFITEPNAVDSSV